MTKQENSEKVKLSSVKSKQIREAELAQKIFKKLNTQKSENDVNLGQESQEIIKLQKEIAQLREENFNIKTISTLERAGCLKPELVLKSVPKDCEDIDK